jgi:myosin heavy subunit
VTYDNAGFLEKNKDQLTDDAFALFQTSSFKFLASLFPSDSSSGAGSGLSKKVSLGTKFTRQLGELMAALNQTEPHYIRCIKPNPNKAQLQYVGGQVYEQLQYAGVFEAITIRKQGFPFRLTHYDFFQRYKCLFPNTHRWGTNHVDNCKTLIAEMKQDLRVVQIGTTKVLYRSEQHRDMELRRNLAVEEVTVYIQKHMRIKMTQLLVARCQKIKPVYAAAIASRNMDQVEAALAQGAGVGFKTVEYFRCERMKFVFQEERRLDGVLAILVTQNPHEIFRQLQEAVTSANDIEMNTPNAQRARQLLAEAEAYRYQIDQEAMEQVQKLEEPNMKAVLERADAVGYSTEAIEKIRTLLYDTAEDAFVKASRTTVSRRASIPAVMLTTCSLLSFVSLSQMQLKAAVQFKDRERVTRTTIRLKDLFFEKSGDMFKFVKYGKLYPNNAWADLKFLSMDREQLASGMLRWTKQPIHNSLTQIPEEDKLTQKLAKELFKNILGYMGDKKYDNPNLLAHEILTACLANKDLRTEVFCQLIKQLVSARQAQTRTVVYDELLAHFRLHGVLSSRRPRIRIRTRRRRDGSS